MNSAKRSFSRAHLTTGISALALLGYSCPLLAHTPAVEASAATEHGLGGLEEIVVTAQRRSENLQKVPIAITAITSQFLANSATMNTLQLERVAPGVQVYQVASNALPFIRGIGSNQASVGFEAAVAVYLDGVYQGAKGNNIFDLGAIERIEVLKGPQGTLFGRNATGGAISIITADPASKPFINAEVGYGRYSEKRAKIYAGGAITDTLSASIAATGRWDNGYVFNRTLGENMNPAKNAVILGKLVWKPTDRLTARFSSSYSYSKDATILGPHVYPGTVPIAGGTPNFQPSYDFYETTLDHKTKIVASAERYTLNLNYDLDRAKLVSITGYVKGKGISLSDSDMSQAPLQYAGAFQPSNQFTQELQIQSGPGPFTYIAGLYYMYFKEGYGDIGSANNFISAANIPAPIRPADLSPANGGTGPANASAVGISSSIVTKSYAAFLQATYEIAESTRLTAGIRYSRDTKHVFGNSYFYTALPGATNTNVPLFNTVLAGDGLVFGTRPLANFNLSKSFSKPTFRVSLDHQFSKDVMVYASFNRGFKAGAYNPAVVSPTQLPVSPEVLDAFEVGLKSELFDRRVRFNAAAFYYNYKDIQVGLITGVGISTVQNAAKARVLGFDGDVTAIVTDALTLRGSLSLLDANYKKYGNAQVFLPRVSTAACPALPPQVSYQQAKQIAATAVPAGVGGNCSYSLNASGQDLIFAPKWSFNVGGDYNVPLGDSRMVFSTSLYVNAGYDIAPGGIFAHVNRFETLAASVTYYSPGDKYFIRAWGDNLTDDHHSIYISPQATGYQDIRSRPVTYGMTVGVKL